MNNYAAYIEWGIILLLICFIVILYFIIKFYRFPNKLHLKNRMLSQKILSRVQEIGETQPARVMGLLRKINPFVFEELLLTAFKKQNFRVKHNFRYTGDKGIDGVIFDENGRKYLIQAKRYQSAINPSHVENFSKVVDESKAHLGFFIHTGRTGKKSYFYRGENVHIISGHRLVNLLMSKPFK